MKKITKSLMTLALLVLGVTSVNAAEKRVLVKEFDFSTMSVFPFYTHTDFSKTIIVEDGGLKIVNPPATTVSGDKALFVADWMIPDKGANYVAVFTYKSTVAGTANLSMDPWGTGASSTVTFEESEDFITAEALFENYPNEGHNNQYGGDTHIIMNIGSLEGTIILQKVQVFQLVPDAPVASTGQNGWLDNILTNVDFTGDDFSCYQAKNWISTEENGVIGDPIIEDGVIKVICNEVKTPKIDPETGEQQTEWWGGLSWNEAAWDAQFWIVTPNTFAKGTKFYLKFDYKADNAGTASTQEHAAPGSYLGNSNINGNINFTTEWNTYEGEYTVQNNNFQSIAFNLNEDVEANAYYFKNISIQLPNIVESVALTAGPAGWASFCYDKAVSAINAAGAYAVEFAGTYVRLIKVDAIPANAPVIINANEGNGIIQLPVIESADPIATNDLQVSDGTITGAENIFALANGNKGVGFYRVANDVVIPAGKVYLQVPADGREFIGFDETTAVNAIAAAHNNNVIFNLAGQRVVKAQKGLYIMNGKKVLVK